MRIVSVVRQSGRNSLHTKRKREGEEEEVGWGGVGGGGGEGNSCLLRRLGRKDRTRFYRDDRFASDVRIV